MRDTTPPDAEAPRDISRRPHTGLTEAPVVDDIDVRAMAGASVELNYDDSVARAGFATSDEEASAALHGVGNGDGFGGGPDMATGGELRAQTTATVDGLGQQRAVTGLELDAVVRAPRRAGGTGSAVVTRAYARPAGRRESIQVQQDRHNALSETPGAHPPHSAESGRTATVRRLASAGNADAADRYTSPSAMPHDPTVPGAAPGPRPVHLRPLPPVSGAMPRL